MREFALIALCAGLVAGLGGPTYAQDAFDWSNVSPVEKLMSKRAARLDALRELAELVKSLPIGRGSVLGDLGPDTSVFLAGATAVGQAQYTKTGFCKLSMKLPAERVLTEAFTLARARKAQIDMDRLRRAVGTGLEVTGLGRPRSAARRGTAPPKDDRQGSLRDPDKRMAKKDPADTQRRPRPEERFSWRNNESKPRERDPDLEAWRRKWEQRSKQWDDEWRRDADEWKRKHNSSQRRWGRLGEESPSIADQWKRGRPIGDGWRQLRDGSKIRLISETIIKRTPVRVRSGGSERWGTEVIEETVYERIVVRRTVVK